MDISKTRDAISVIAEKRRSKKHQSERPREVRKYKSVFPMLFPSSFGTPNTGAPYDVPEFGGGGSSGDSSRGGASESSGATKKNVIHELRKALGLSEHVGHNHAWSNAPNPAWGGYSVPNFGMVQTRQGGPTIGGPGFQNDTSKGGVYSPQKSPGIGFRTDAGWRIWMAALEVMRREKMANPNTVLHRAMAMARIPRSQMDPAEIRLLEMGIEWYLSDAGSLSAKRGAGFGGQGASPTDSGGFMSGGGAPSGSI